MFNPIEEAQKAIDNSKLILDKTKNVIPNPLESIKETAESLNNFTESTKGFFSAIGNITDFISKCFTDPSFLIDKVQMVGADVLLIVLLAVVILRFLGFEGVTKYGALALVIAVIIAML